MANITRVHERAGQPARPQDLIDLDKLLSAYESEHPDPSVPGEQIAFGTSGHRGSSLNRAFNRDHVLATTQAVCDFRAEAGVSGPLFLAVDTHALSRPAFQDALEVFAGNGVQVRVDRRGGYTPTPALSLAILTYNAGRTSGLADGVVLTPSHNPPADGGYKYNPTTGGPADTDITANIQRRANQHLADGLKNVRRASVDLDRDPPADTVGRYDFLGHYVSQLPTVIDIDAIRQAGVRIGVDPLGGAAVAYWQEIGDRYGLNLTVVNTAVDPTFSFMSLDWDGKIRMDCSSAYAMASLVAQKDRFDLAVGNDADADRHGVVTPDEGLMNPNHFLAAAIHYLFRHRPDWPASAGIGKTLVSSSMIDRVASDLGRRLVETPVGFKWLMPGLFSGELGFGGEESAGASLLRRDGRVWTTDKDGIALCLLAAEMAAVMGQTPSASYRQLVQRFGVDPIYERIDAPATPDEKAALARLTPEQVRAAELAGEPITKKLTRAPGNDEPIGGIKVISDGGWFAARPSGTESTYKIYAESFRGRDHLKKIQAEAHQIVTSALREPA